MTPTFPGIKFWLLAAGLQACGTEGSIPHDAPVAQDGAEEASCVSCHPEQAKQWEGSHHAQAERVSVEGVPERVSLDDGTGVRDWPVAGWLGVAPFVQPLVDQGSGRLQASSMAWDPARKEWFSVFSDRRQPGDFGHWTGEGMTWNRQCAPCHNTGLTSEHDPVTDQWTTERRHRGVHCTACHGELGPHGADAGEVPAVAMDTCAGCHSRRGDLTGGFQPGDRYLDHYAPQFVDRTEAYYANGRVREENFATVSFWGSRMAEAGVTCNDCHEPHSGQLRQEGDALCLSCHAEQEGFEAHDFHAEPVACVDCHMPVTTYMQRDPRRGHAFAIPDPLLSAEVGAPGACQACHADQSGDALNAALVARGLDPSGRPQRARARAIAAARLGDDRLARERLATEEHPQWRAHLASVLSDVDPVSQALAASLSTDPDPRVRYAATGALAPGHPALGARIGDPVRAVRVQAARGMADHWGPERAGMVDFRRYLERHSDSLLTQLELAAWQDRHGDPKAASTVAWLVKRWPDEPEVRVTQATHRLRQGDEAGAISVLEAAALAQPDAAGVWDALGRVRAGAGDVAGAATAFRQAVDADPKAARSWYNLGLAQQQLGRLGEAEASLTASVSADPTDPDVHWARGVLALQQGKAAESRAHARAALAHDPRHPGANSLLRTQEVEP